MSTEIKLNGSLGRKGGTYVEMKEEHREQRGAQRAKRSTKSKGEHREQRGAQRAKGSTESKWEGKEQKGA